MIMENIGNSVSTLERVTKEFGFLISELQFNQFPRNIQGIRNLPLNRFAVSEEEYKSLIELRKEKEDGYGRVRITFHPFLGWKN